jgi:hypothetical protein
VTEESDLVAAVAALTSSAAELSTRLEVQEQLVRRIEEQRRGLHATRIALVVTIVGLILDLGLTGAFGVLYRQVSENQQNIVSVQQRTSTDILCPLYQAFALGIKSNPTPTGLTPEQQQFRQNAGATITAGLGKLGCK